MPLYQCDKCGCVENTALSDAAHPAILNGPIRTGKEKEAFQSYRVVLGLLPHQPFGKYCSACSPIWFDEKGGYGIGKNPKPEPGTGEWHNQFDRKFYKLGTLFTDQNGNIRSTLKTPWEEQEIMPPQFVHYCAGKLKNVHCAEKDCPHCIPNPK